ncbi:MAG: GNAT family N-acetyltransferase [Candidatus Woesearchaeota archaeon]
MSVELFHKKYSEDICALLKEFLEYTREAYSVQVLEFDNYIDSKQDTYAQELLSSFVELKKSRFLIAHHNSEVVGYIVGSIEKKPNKVMKKSGYIHSFFVTKKYRGAGLGKQLYDSLVDWFKKQRCDHLELSVFDGNQKTISTYKKWGFKENAIKMKKKL